MSTVCGAGTYRVINLLNYLSCVCIIVPRSQCQQRKSTQRQHNLNNATISFVLDNERLGPDI